MTKTLFYLNKMFYWLIYDDSKYDIIMKIYNKDRSVIRNGKNVIEYMI